LPSRLPPAARFRAKGFRWRARGTHQDYRFAFLEQNAEIGRSAHFQNDGGEQSVFTIDGSTGERETLHAKHCVFGSRRQRFEVLQPVELAGKETACGHRGTHHNFHDIRRQADYIFHHGAQLIVEFGGERCRRGRRGRAAASDRETTG